MSLGFLPLCDCGVAVSITSNGRIAHSRDFSPTGENISWFSGNMSSTAPQVFRALPIPGLPASLFLPQHSSLAFSPKARGQCEAEAQRGTLVPAFSSYLARALACRYRTPSKCSLGIPVFQTAGHKCYQPQLQPTDPCREPQS